MPPVVTRDDVRDAIAALSADRTRYVGIDGFGAAGKTSLTQWLAAGLTDAIVIHIDDFAGPQTPEWDWDRLRAQVLEPLRVGRTGRYQRWDWAMDQGQEWHVVQPGGIVLIEGVSATRQEVGLDWDLTVWVDTPVDLRRERALRRDGAAMWTTWQERWIPPELAYAERERPQERVDLVVLGDGHRTSQDGQVGPRPAV